MSKGYACIKGLQGAYALNAPDRILRPLKRNPSGSFDEIDLEQALDEISQKMATIMGEDGSQSIATFKGTQAYMHAPLAEIIRNWMTAIDSPSLFSTMTIDQSAKLVAMERLGVWAGDRHHMLESDVLMIVGGNPLVSIAVIGVTPFNMTLQLKAAKARGMKLIVVDPRKTETAKIADIHLQVRPGQDPALFAGLIREVLHKGWEDRNFCTDYVSGLEEMRAAVEGFTVDVVQQRTGVPANLIKAAARMFALESKRGFATTGTGPSMAPHSNLSEHLIQCLNIICGRFNREGEAVQGAGLIRPRQFVAEVIPPQRTWERGHKSRVRGFGMLFGEMMSATLPEEILTPGKGRIRALVVTGGNPAVALPDQKKTVAALRALDLLVAVEPYMTATAKLAHYILPPLLQYEREDFLFGPDFEFFNPAPFQQYVTAAVPPPPGSQLIEDWRVFFELAKRLGKQIVFVGEPLDMARTPTTEELLRRVIAGGPLSIDELRKHPRGQFIDVPVAVVGKGRIAPDLRFQIAPADVTAGLSDVLAEDTQVSTRFNFLLVSRRIREVMNTVGMNFPGSRERVPYNPAFLHPKDIATLGLAPGDKVEIHSDNGAIEAIVEEDPSVSRGVVSMTHCFGGLPGDEMPYEEIGSCTSLLVSVDRDYEEINAMPRMSAIPVEVIPLRSTSIRSGQGAACGALYSDSAEVT